MESVYDVAQCIVNEYNRIFRCEIDEMKLQKLLYYAQRDSIAIVGTPMFEAEFEGWRYGPVCKSIREAHSSKRLNEGCKRLSPFNSYIVTNLVVGLGSVDSWELSIASHEEYSWQKARSGLKDDDVGSATIDLSDIMEDAQRTRPYDYHWDMYFDEFDDVECE